MTKRLMPWLAAAWLLALAAFAADPVFLEGESFSVPDDGWRVRGWAAASADRALTGASGPGGSVATAPITLAQAGQYRIWVRYITGPKYRGPFDLSIRQGDTVLATHTFDLEAPDGLDAIGAVWQSYVAELPAGELTVALAKHEGRSCSGWARLVDCLLITPDLDDKAPHFADYGPQTYLRATLLEGDYREPVQIHIWVPFVGHYHLSRKGLGSGTAPRPNQRLRPGDTTPWCRVSRLLQPRLQVGARFIINARYSYADTAERLHVRLQLATAPDDAAIVRTIEADYRPGTLYLILPENLTTAENRARITLDRDLAESTGKLTDDFDWPTLGKPVERFPYFAAATMPGGGEFAPDARIVERERRTLAHFGFVNGKLTWSGSGTWKMVDHCQWLPDLPAIQAGARKVAERFLSTDSVDKLAYVKMMDEPGAAAASRLADQPTAAEPFRDWLRAQNFTPASLGVATWDDVKPVARGGRTDHPELYYHTQRFRSVVLARFFHTQQQAICQAFGRDIPCIGNFSDLAVYHGNLYTGAADYFELVDGADLNALWSECGGAFATSQQCTDYNVDLMRGAARGRQLQLGHYLIDYGRPLWDNQCKAVGHLARDVKAMINYVYGPTWINYEGGPPWTSSALYNRPAKWRGESELARSIGWAEELLLTGRRPAARVAILYTQSTDIWQLQTDCSYGYDRMHIWLALAHGQVPVDILSERQAATGALAGYRVCYVAGPNLTRAAAAALRTWTEAGGTLVLTANAARRDEYNRPLDVLDSLLPATPGDVAVDPFVNYGKALGLRRPLATVTAGDDRFEVVCVNEALTARPGAEVLATAAEGSPAWAAGPAGKGRVHRLGFLPGLSYAAPAARARYAAERQDDPDPLTDELLGRTRGSWAWPAPVRAAILGPVRAAAIQPPITCDVPEVDAGLLVGPDGVLLTLANWTYRPIDALHLSIRLDRPVTRAESVHHGSLPLESTGGVLKLTLPLDAFDLVKLLP